MRNIILNSKKTFERLHVDKIITNDDVSTVVDYFLETMRQYNKMIIALSGIADEDLTTAERQIKKILES